MSKSIKVFGLIGLSVLVAACAGQQEEEEIIFVEPEPVSQEPVYTGKYK